MAKEAKRVAASILSARYPASDFHVSDENVDLMNFNYVSE